MNFKIAETSPIFYTSKKNNIWLNMNIGQLKIVAIKSSLPKRDGNLG